MKRVFGASILGAVVVFGAGALASNHSTAQPRQPVPAIEYHRLGTLNSCTLYSVRHNGREYLLAAAHQSGSVSCSLTSAPAR